MFESLITIMTAFYTVSHPSFATVRFQCENDLGLIVTIIHQAEMKPEVDEWKTCVESYDFLGDEASEKIEVENKDTLIILAKRHDKIMASQVFEVDMTTVSQGYLLIPKGGFNLLCNQEEQLRYDDLVAMKKQATQERLYVIVE